MSFPVGTAVIIDQAREPFLGATGMVVCEPAQATRTVRVLLDDDERFTDQLCLLTQLQTQHDCLACGDPVPVGHVLCGGCDEPSVA